MGYIGPLDLVDPYVTFKQPLGSKFLLFHFSVLILNDDNRFWNCKSTNISIGDNTTWYWTTNTAYGDHKTGWKECDGRVEEVFF